MQLRYRPPYDWETMLTFLRGRAIAGVEAVSGTGANGSYARTIDIDGQHGSVIVRPGKGHGLKVTVRHPRLSALPAIIARVRRQFDLAADPQAIGAHLAEDPRLAPLVAARPGLRVPGAWDGFELAVRAVVGQQITVRGAIGILSRLVAHAGEPLAVAGAPVDGLTHVFPTAARLAAVPVSAFPMPAARASALVSLARAVAKNPQMFRQGRSLDEVIADLRALKGIGDWTAHYIAMREMREPDAFPAGDVGLQKAFAGADGVRPTAEQLEAAAERWRPWRAYAAQHLWMSLAVS